MNPNNPVPIPAMKPLAVSSPRSTLYYRWLVVGMLWFICFFNYADRQAIFSIFPVLEKQYHFTKSELGAIGAAFTWIYAFAAPVAGHVGDRYPRKWVILAGLTMWSLITGLTAQCTKVWQFMLVRGSEGLGETFYMPASMALISDYHAPATRSRAIGLHQTSHLCRNHWRRRTGRLDGAKVWLAIALLDSGRRRYRPGPGRARVYTRTTPQPGRARGAAAGQGRSALQTRKESEADKGNVGAEGA